MSDAYIRQLEEDRDRYRRAARKYRDQARTHKKRADDTEAAATELAEHVEAVHNDPTALYDLLAQTGALDQADEPEPTDDEPTGEEYDDGQGYGEGAVAAEPEPEPPAPRLPTRAEMVAALKSGTPVVVPHSLTKDAYAWTYETRNELGRLASEGLVNYTD